MPLTHTSPPALACQARATKSYASFELCASMVQFVPNVNLIVPPLYAATVQAPGGVDSLKNVSVAREVLRHVALGLHANPSVEITPLCVYVRGMLLTHLPPQLRYMHSRWVEAPFLVLGPGRVVGEPAGRLWLRDED